MSTQHVEQADAQELAWKEYAEACCEHDPVQGRHALAEIAAHIPEQRKPGARAA